MTEPVPRKSPRSPAPLPTQQQYAVVSARRSGTDAMMWQVPALSLTAQAFLINISLTSDSLVSRITTAVLGLITAVASVQLILKHRRNELIDRLLLERMEEQMRAYPAHARPEVVAADLGMAKASWVERIRSHNLWVIALSLFGLAAIFGPISKVLFP